MNDTSPEALAVVLAARARMTPAERIAQALELSETMREMALVRLRAQHPDRSTLQLVELLLGQTLVPEGWAKAK